MRRRPPAEEAGKSVYTLNSLPHIVLAGPMMTLTSHCEKGDIDAEAGAGAVSREQEGHELEEMLARLLDSPNGTVERFWGEFRVGGFSRPPLPLPPPPGQASSI